MAIAKTADAASVGVIGPVLSTSSLITSVTDQTQLIVHDRCIFDGVPFVKEGKYIFYEKNFAE